MDHISTFTLRREAPYACRVVRELPIWNLQRRDYKSNLRATFRHWRPDASGDPTYEMWSVVMAEAGPPNEEDHKWWSNASDEKKQAAARRAAVLVGLRAAAEPSEGETGGQEISLGSALFEAGLSDHRLMRLLTEHPERRLEAFRRALVRISSQRIPIQWTKVDANGRCLEDPLRYEVGRVLCFLYGNADAAKKAANAWAADFFRARYHKEKSEEEPETEKV